MRALVDIQAPTELISERLKTDNLKKEIIACDIDSLDVLELLFELEEAYDIDIPRTIDEDMRGGMTVGQLIAVIDELRTT